MSKKSYITLCIVGIMFVIMASTAVLSPHVSDASDYDANVGHKGTYITPLTGLKDELTVVNSADITVAVPLENMPIFKVCKVSVEIGGNTTMFKAAEFKSLYAWTGFSGQSGEVIVTMGDNTQKSFLLSDLRISENCYICYANEQGEQLDTKTYGNFCLVVAKGENAGFYKDIRNISIG